MPAVVKSLLT